MNFFKKGEPRIPKHKSNPSLPGGRLVRGYEIRKLPFGAYLEALEKLQNLPGDLLSACFPGKSLDDILTDLKALDEGALLRLITGMASAGGPYLLGLVSHFSGVPVEELRDNPEIGLDGLVEIVKAVWEVNALGNVVAAVRKALPGKATNTGSRAS